MDGFEGGDDAERKLLYKVLVQTSLITKRIWGDDMQKRKELDRAMFTKL